MKLFNHKVVLFVLLLMVGLWLSAPVWAQESTPEPDVPVVVVDDANPSDLSVNLVQVIIGLLTAFAAGGIIGIAGLAVFVDRLRSDTAMVTALEKLAESYPPGTRDILLNVSKTIDSIGELGKEVFDNVPVADKETVKATALNEAPH